MPLRDIKLSRIPPSSLHPTKYSRLDDDQPEPTPRSAASYETDIEGYIGSGTDTAGGRTPATDKRLSLSFGHPDEFDLSDGDEKDDDPHIRPRRYGNGHIDTAGSDSDEADLDTMDPSRPSYLRPGDGRSGVPLLYKPEEEEQEQEQEQERGRLQQHHGDSRSSSPFLNTPTDPPAHFSRRSTMRSRSPDTQARMAARKKYTYAAVFLVISLISFTVQTELASYVQVELGWNKAYCMLYLTHGSWSMLWPVQLVILRLQKWNMPWQTFWRRHVFLIRSTAHMVRAQELDVPKRDSAASPWPYIAKTTAFVTTALTVAGLSWYLAVDMTSPSDLTAIYNCSAFFAYAFSVPLLKEKLRLDKSVAVLIAIVGVMVVAYGDSKGKTTEGGSPGHDKDAGTRFLGNLIIGAGSVLYGLYEVLYKRWACPPEGVSAGRGMIFANAFGSCIGLFTLTVLWIPLPILHWLGWETFELPTGETAFYLWISVVMNATFAGSFLVLISLTSPVLSSVAALLTIFIVAIADWALTGERMSLAAIGGGALIVVAFLMLSWSTWREMVEDRAREAAGDVDEGDWDSGTESDNGRLH